MVRKSKQAARLTRLIRTIMQGELFQTMEHKGKIIEILIIAIIKKKKKRPETLIH